MSLDNFILECEKDNKELEDTIKVLKNKIQRLTRENEELKSQLRGTTHCFDEEEHNKLKEEITNLSKEIDMWNSKYNDMFDENKRLKEALEAKLYCKYANKCDELDDCSREEYEDMANANVRLSVENYDLKEENQKLKKQLEEWEHHLKCSKEMLDIQGQKGNYDYDEYMHGLYNGMEYIIALFETREPNFISGKDVEFTNNKAQQKEFIKWLENGIEKVKNTEFLDERIQRAGLIAYNRCLQKYKSIIGENDV